MHRDELARAIRDKAHLTGEFRLRSGGTSKEYFDKYQFEADPSLLREIARQLATLVPAETEVLAGLELGGVPIAVALALETGLPLAFVRKVAKSYGTCRFSEGIAVAGRRVLVVEDVVTGGGQVVASTEQLREVGAGVFSALCVIDREAGGAEALRKIDLPLRALFTQSELARTLIN
ncbi:MAG: orotate phosphoribosyltransferase [Polyangiaceae bacterium]